MRFLALCAWLASLLANASADGGPSYQNFSLSCTDVGLFHGFFLNASCCYPVVNNADARSQNLLDLTMCIGLDQVSGRLQWEVYGKFSNYCTNCTLLAAPRGSEAIADGSDHFLTCSCTQLVGGYGPIQSTLNLDDGIGNDNGTLQCAGGMAALTPPGGY